MVGAGPTQHCCSSLQGKYRTHDKWVLSAGKEGEICLWCRQDGRQLEESSAEAILGFQNLNSKCNRISGALSVQSLHTVHSDLLGASY